MTVSKLEINAAPIIRLISDLLDKDPALREEVITDVMRTTGKERWEVEKFIADASMLEDQ